MHAYNENQICHKSYPGPLDGEVIECKQLVFHAPPCTPDQFTVRKHRKHIPVVTAPAFDRYTPRRRAGVSA